MSTPDKRSPRLSRPNRQRIWRWGGIAIVASLLLFFAVRQINKGSGGKIFTEYPPLPQDTIPDYFNSQPQDKEEELAPSEAVMTDTLTSDSLRAELMEPRHLDIDLFTVNREYHELDSPRLEASTAHTHWTGEHGLFEELLLPQKEATAWGADFADYARQPLISTHSVLEMLSLLGQQVLTDGPAPEAREMIRLLAASDDIKEIVLADRSGRVVLSTNSIHQGQPIDQVFESLSTTKQQLQWSMAQDRTLTALPIYHRYGRIGTAVLVTRP